MMRINLNIKWLLLTVFSLALLLFAVSSKATSATTKSPFASFCPKTISCTSGEITPNFASNLKDWKNCTCDGGTCKKLIKNNVTVDTGGYTYKGKEFTYYNDDNPSNGLYASSSDEYAKNQGFNLMIGNTFVCGN